MNIAHKQKVLLLPQSKSLLIETIDGVLQILSLLTHSRNWPLLETAAGARGCPHRHLKTPSKGTLRQQAWLSQKRENLEYSVFCLNHGLILPLLAWARSSQEAWWLIFSKMSVKSKKTALSTQLWQLISSGISMILLKYFDTWWVIFSKMLLAKIWILSLFVQSRILSHLLVAGLGYDLSLWKRVFYRCWYHSDDMVMNDQRFGLRILLWVIQYIGMNSSRVFANLICSVHDKLYQWRQRTWMKHTNLPSANKNKWMVIPNAFGWKTSLLFVMFSHVIGDQYALHKSGNYSDNWI